jgi:hypothetical protein
MATDWASIAQTVASALGGGTVGAWLNGVRQDRADRDRRRDQAAEILAEARALLTDANPDRLGMNANPATFEQTFTDLGDRWQRTRVPLLTIGAGHPSERVRYYARQLEVAIAGTLTMSRWHVRDLLENRDARDARNTANQHHAEATRLLGELEQAIHQPRRRVFLWRRERRPIEPPGPGA